MATETLADADWLAMALSGLPPVRAGRFFVYGAHDRGRIPANAVGLRIEAGAAFGTGHHGTTVGCLLAFDALLKAPPLRRACWTSGPAPACSPSPRRAPARRVAVGTDIDAVSVRIARENAAPQPRPRPLRPRRRPGAPRRSRGAAPYDLVFANILARPLVRLAPGHPPRAEARRAWPSSPACCAASSATCSAAYLARGFRLERRYHRDAWATLVLARR